MKVYVEIDDTRKITTYHNGLGTKQGLYIYGKDKIEVLYLFDYTKQVRKQVCDEIRQEFEKHTFYWYKDEENVNKELYIDSDWVWEVLDQIEKGE